MTEELFYDHFDGDELDTRNWIKKGGMRGERGGLPWPFNRKFESGRMQIGNSYVTLYGGGEGHDYLIRTVRTFNPFVDGSLIAEVRAYIARPNLKHDDFWLSFRVTEDQFDKYVPLCGLSVQERSSPKSLKTKWQYLTRKYADYNPDYQIRFNNVIAKNIDEERDGLSKTVVSKVFDIPQKEWHNLKLMFGKNSQAAYVDEILAAEMNLMPANTDYRFTLYVMNDSMLTVDKIRIFRE